MQAALLGALVQRLSIPGCLPGDAGSTPARAYSGSAMDPQTVWTVQRIAHQLAELEIGPGSTRCVDKRQLAT